MTIEQILIGIVVLGGAFLLWKKSPSKDQKIAELEVKKQEEVKKVEELKSEQADLKEKIENEQKDATEEQKDSFWKDYNKK